MTLDVVVAVKQLPATFRGWIDATGSGVIKWIADRRTGVLVGATAVGPQGGERLGFLSLAGIIINNAIVLLDSIQNEIDAGAAPFDAIITASLTRFKPVIMTTITTILGLISLMIPPDPLFFAMAVVISFGLAVGTVLTLIVVPVLYTLFFRVKVPKRAAV